MGEVSQWWVAAARLAPSTFALYDHVLMLGMEVQYIWLKPKRRSAYWFFTLRYFVTFGEIVIFVLRFYDPGSEKGCLAFQTFINAQTLFIELLVVALMSMRVYALYECSKRVMWFMITVAGCLLPLVGWSLVMSSIGTVLLQGMICGRTFPERRASFTWGSAFVYDCLIFTLTIRKTHQTQKKVRGTVPVRMPLLELMLRDGVIYFGVMCVVHFANLILCATRSSGMTALARTISAVMALRLILNLHERASEGLLLQGTSAGLTTMSNSQTSNSILTTLAFRSGSLDELEYELDRFPDRDDELGRDQDGPSGRVKGKEVDRDTSRDRYSGDATHAESSTTRRSAAVD
ncbi:hypothetical protein D9758_007476 [Tetrapyrgos nigripes]|uniref:DUF6533 domain-containing protein n=1 Tax=Tetrapyrgos nigripes TaxID=182062 RepID=A0A8H5LHF0_9AGAR|nr:hypothetical protein D9758_007476 [Tetrapyrgos nigripes]